MEFEQWLGSRPRREVAEKLGVHRMTLNRYARGQIMPRPSMIEAIARLTAYTVTDADLRTAYRKYHAS